VVGTTVGAITAVVLLGLAGLHWTWVRGGHWPAASGRDLVTLITPPWMPSPTSAQLALAAGALTVAGFVIGINAAGVDTWITWPAAALVGTGLALRGVAGLILSGVWRRDSPFARLDRRAISPLCIALALGSLAALPG